MQERKTALAKKVAEKAKTYTTLAESSELFKNLDEKSKTVVKVYAEHPTYVRGADTLWDGYITLMNLCYGDGHDPNVGISVQIPASDKFYDRKVASNSAIKSNM